MDAKRLEKLRVMRSISSRVKFVAIIFFSLKVFPK